jgi:site-specific recombinase XerD
MEYLVGERNLSNNTQQSYRDTLTLLLPFTGKQKRKTVDLLVVEDLSSQVLRDFLDHLEKQRGCSIRTRNQRLAAVHAMARFIAERSPEHIAWAGEVRIVPFKRFDMPALSYLEKAEIDAILAAPDCRSPQGYRDHVLLLFLYNSGARVSEAAGLKITDLDLHPNTMSIVKLLGKGGKTRRCPLWAATAKGLITLIRDRPADQPVFLNRLGQSLTRHGIHEMLRRHVRKASASCPSLLRKRISPHTIRHTTATHLLRSGVDINTIRAWLGHVSIDTTNIYAEVDLERKAQMLAQCAYLEPVAKRKTHWRDDTSLMAFLRSL